MTSESGQLMERTNMDGWLNIHGKVDEQTEELMDGRINWSFDEEMDE